MFPLSFNGMGAVEWNPLMLVAAFLLIAVIVVLIRMMGPKGAVFKKFRVQPFLSGNKASEKNIVHADNFFWGFTEAFKKYYEKMFNIHSGQLNDYLFWFVFSLALVLIALYAGVYLWA